MFERAYKEGYAIGAFNVNNMEIIQGIMEAGTEEKAPLILQVSAGARKYAGQNYIVKLIEAGLLEADLPVVLHLDHGADFDICKACVDGGFTSVMIDGSHHSFEDNIAVTKRVVEYAHAHGVWVEAELGRLAGVEEDVSSEHSIYTDPDQAVEFVERSGCDSLAIAIGTSHGAYKFKGEAKLDFERLEKIGSLMPGYPLVLHGASSVPQEFVEMCNTYGGKVAGAAGVPEELLRKAAGMAICKINIDTDIRLAMTASIRKQLVEHPEEFDPRGYLKPARQAVKDMVQHKIQACAGLFRQGVNQLSHGGGTLACNAVASPLFHTAFRLSLCGRAGPGVGRIRIVPQTFSRIEGVPQWLASESTASAASVVILSALWLSATNSPW